MGTGIGAVAADLRARLADVPPLAAIGDGEERRIAVENVLGVPFRVDELVRRLAATTVGDGLDGAGELWPRLVDLLAAAARAAAPPWRLELPGVLTVTGSAAGVQVTVVGPGPTGVPALPADPRLSVELRDLDLVPGVLRVARAAVALTLPVDPAAAAATLDLTGLTLRLADGLTAVLTGGRPTLEGAVGAELGESGVRFRGGGRSGVRVPVRAVPGLEAPALGLGPHVGGVRFGVSFGARLLGVLDASVEDVGVEVRADPPSARAVPPRGIGVRVALGPVRGGGHLAAQDDGRFAGAMLLRLPVAEVAAFGLLRPDPLSLLMVLSARFAPPIELGLAFTLNAVGGIVGIGYAVDADGLRTAIRDGRADDLLFPDDPARAAPRILRTLGQVFREQRGGLVVGPMLRLGWGRPVSFLTADLGVILEVTSGRVFLLGRLRVALPTPATPVIELRAGVDGTIDAGTGLVELRASLAGSRLLFAPIDGGLAVRAQTGRDASFVLSAGGFHPRYPAPAGFPALTRLTIPIADSPLLRIVFTGYLAITPGTVQIGAQLDAVIGSSSTGVSGRLGFDALVRWEASFGVVLSLVGSFRLRVAGRTICAVDLRVLVEGPTPCWHVAGRASVSLFFLTVSFPFDEHWACTRAVGAPPPPDVGRLLHAALADPRSWAALPADGSPVTLRATDEGLLHPLGALRFSQRVVPLGVPVTRHGPARLPAPTVFDVAVTAATEMGASREVREQFARAEHLDLTDDERLTGPAFEALRSGAELSPPAAVTAGPAVAQTVAYETKWLGRPALPTGPAGSGFTDQAVAVGAVARSAAQRDRARWQGPAAPPVLRPRSYAAADPLTLRPLAEQVPAGTLTELAARVRARRGTLAGVALVPSHEVRP